MYKILIVDDEAVVREGIRDNIDWNSHGYSFVGDCENGLDAMEAVDSLMPDVVLTDICMPFMDGMELAKYISEKYPRIRIVILTGFEEFEYAQQAVKLKAYDFILKPITSLELKKILAKIKGDLDAEKEEREDISRLKIQLRESLPLLRERFLNRLVSGNIGKKELSERLQYFNVKLSGEYFVSMIVDIDDYSALPELEPGIDNQLFPFAVFNISEEISANSDNSVVFQNRNDGTAIILAGGSKEDLYERAVKIAEDIKQSIERYLGFTVTIGIGSISCKLEDIAFSYEKSLSALDYRFLLGKNQVISVLDMERNAGNTVIYNRNLDKELISEIKTGSSNKIAGVIYKIIKYLEEGYVSMHKCHVYVQQLIVSLLNLLDEMDIPSAEIFKNTSTPFAEIYQLKTLEDMKAWLGSVCSGICKAVAAKRNDFCEDIVIKAKEYIFANYNDEDISLNSICKHLLISTSYFSLIFKNSTGETFIEFLSRVRIEKAMELLKSTNMKTYEIAEKIGYGDSHYFSMVFKRMAGTTPTEYRVAVKGEN